MSRLVTFDQLEKTLTGFGFVTQPRVGHVIFRHAETGAIMALPKGTKFVRPIYVSTAARVIQNSGIATSTAFDAKLAELARSQPRPAHIPSRDHPRH